MEPVLTTVVVWTEEHGIEPIAFSEPRAAFTHMANLKELQAYRFVKIYASRVELTPTQLREWALPG